MASAKYTKQITGIIDQHIEHVIQVLAQKFEFDVDEAFLINALNQMLAGEQITKPVSKALGCSIKF